MNDTPTLFDVVHPPPDIRDDAYSYVGWFAPGTSDGAVWVDIANRRVLVRTWEPFSGLSVDDARALTALIEAATAWLEATA